GAIAATSNMYPKLVVSIYENWKNGEIEKAREAQEKLRKIRDASNLASTPAVFKAAMEILGVSAGPPRYPVEQVSEEVKNKLIEIMNEYK
ncbi:dihydrodipicolinate synthase family protein, partial [Robertmurraya massiliosenegalensis]|uniref:dihydrodipicolinate synthase family protein n=1 Tax=Robertmurraya massiliosenegalensis TaxID=1287657 RepID=UPI000474B27A